jgi:GNAT superfamily N-acetyltransferase
MKLEKASYNEALTLYKEYYNQFHFGIDGYYEKRILSGEHYMLIDMDPVGIVSINDGQLTCFYIFDNHNGKYKEYFNFILNQDIVNRILFSTIDTLLYKEIQDRNLKIEYQAYNFVFNLQVNTDFHMELATREHLGFLKENFLDFIEQSIGCNFEAFTKKVDTLEIFIGFDTSGTPISMGMIEPMIINPNRYCLGMIVLENHRKKGYGVKTLKFLIKYLQDRNKEVNARCWYYNEASLNTLIKTGFEVSNLLLKVENIEKLE